MKEAENCFYSKGIIVQYYECDYRNDIRLSFLLKHGQQIGMEQCDNLGIGYAFMDSMNMAFLLAKLKGTIYRLPKAGEKLFIRTIPFMPVKAQYQRLVEFYDEQQQLIVTLDNRWLLVDTQTRKILRKTPEQLEGYFQHPQELEDFRIPRIKESLEERETVQVRYSQMDTNHHMNNTVYADVITDCAEDYLIETEENPISAFTIVYHHEAKLGEKIHLSRKMTESGLVIQGVRETNSCFEGLLQFKE